MMNKEKTLLLIINRVGTKIDILINQDGHIKDDANTQKSNLQMTEYHSNYKKCNISYNGLANLPRNDTHTHRYIHIYKGMQDIYSKKNNKFIYKWKKIKFYVPDHIKYPFAIIFSFNKK